MNEIGRLWTILFLLAILSPLGLMVPEYFGAGGAWGEDSPSGVQKIVGFLPAKMTELAEIWQAPLPDYSLPGTTETTPLASKSWDYFLSAVLGPLLCGGLGLVTMRLLFRKTSAPYRTHPPTVDFK
ncbi:MAG: hypothetical protein JNM39_04545 [Bdellovibrionaceae bacterium]|nr:hypothetical protein [Pseudobdellovibrionaceae bacterium]